MVVRTRLGQFNGLPGKTPMQATGTATNPAVFPANGTLANGTAASNVYYNLVDAFGNVLVAGVATGFAQPVNYQNFVRYCEYPGNRLFSLVKFDVNGNPLDQYDSMIPVMLEKFCTPPNKRDGFDRLVGQEVPLVGYAGLRAGVVNDADAANTPAGITKFAANQSNQTVGLFDAATGQTLPDINGLASTAATTEPLNGVGGPQLDVSRVLLQVVNGAQTPKPIQAPLEVWNKLRLRTRVSVR
jgi:hypothetical protein